MRPRRAPPRGGCLFGRARDTWSAEWFVGCLWQRRGWRGGRRIRWQVRGVSRSGSGECAALAAVRGGDRAGTSAGMALPRHVTLLSDVEGALLVFK